MKKLIVLIILILCETGLFFAIYYAKDNDSIALTENDNNTKRDSNQEVVYNKVDNKNEKKEEIVVEKPKDIDNKTYYLITFCNYDGTVLDKVYVLQGQKPSFSKEYPNNFLYWDKEIVKASHNETYTAVIKSESHSSSPSAPVVHPNIFVVSSGCSGMGGIEIYDQSGTLRPANYQFSNGAQVTIKATPTNAGYDFKGIDTDNDGTVDIAATNPNQSEVSTLTLTYSSNISKYVAYFDYHVFTVTFNMSGIKNDMDVYPNFLSQQSTVVTDSIGNVTIREGQSDSSNILSTIRDVQSERTTVTLDIPYNHSVWLTAENTHSAQYKFSKWSDNGSTSAKREYKCGLENHTVDALFRPALVSELVVGDVVALEDTSDGIHKFDLVSRNGWHTYNFYVLLFSQDPIANSNCAEHSTYSASPIRAKCKEFENTLKAKDLNALAKIVPILEGDSGFGYSHWTFDPAEGDYLNDKILCPSFVAWELTTWCFPEAYRARPNASNNGYWLRFNDGTTSSWNVYVNKDGTWPIHNSTGSGNWNTVRSVMPVCSMYRTAYALYNCVDASNIYYTVFDNTVTLTVNSNDAAMGSASGSGTYSGSQEVTLTATPNPGYTFKQWSDGNTSNPRKIYVTSNSTITATFEAAAN